jgi:hypothetical protein
VSPRTRRAVVGTSYAVLGALVCWSRLVRLDSGYCCDEIRTLVNYVREGPDAILTGPYIPNNHELFSLAGWATTSLVGESEIALRLWSVLPFLIGVAVVTTWLHVRMGALPGILFLFLATASPLLLDISRMARGYGLAFLAMSVLVVAALEAERSRRTAAVVAFVAAGLVGSLTFPHFVVAFLATGVVLLATPELRTRVAVGSGIALIGSVAWYAPHFDDIAESTAGDYGRQIDTAWILTAPIDQTLVPAVTLLDDAFVEPSFASLLWAIGFVMLSASSPLLRQWQPALILCSGVVATVIAFWATGTYVVPRFLSFLLVPLFMLVATGSASILGRLSTRPAPVRTVVAIATFGIVAFLAAPHLVDVARMPRDSTREVASAIRRLVPPTTPVFAYVPYPHDLEFHLGGTVHRYRTPSQRAALCRSSTTSVFVEQRFLLPSASTPCLVRARTHMRFRQFARGGYIDLWIIEPTTA